MFGLTHRSRALAFGFALVAAAAVNTADASAATTTKPFAVTIAPSQVAGGSTTAFTVALTNEASPQQLGSANVTPPAGFTIVSAAPASLVTVVNGTAQLRNLAVQPGQSTNVTITATAPCA